MENEMKKRVISDSTNPVKLNYEHASILAFVPILSPTLYYDYKG